jgi:hypothetical protein
MVEQPRLTFPFKELPGTTELVPRPVVPVTIEGQRTPQYCLLDTGALHNRFGGWVARAAGIDLDGAPLEVIALGGFRAEARRASVLLSVGEASWVAPVWFCDPWPLSFHLLGQKGFFDRFEVTLRAARYEVELIPNPDLS